MGGNILLGFAMLVIGIVIQCVFVSLLVRLLKSLKPRLLKTQTLISTTSVLTRAMLIMVAGNVCQAALWACLFMALGEFQDYGTAFYFSVVNFTTLGYGDVLMSEQHRLLGAFEAGNGVLMLGLTTSVMFLVLHATVQSAPPERDKLN